MEIRFGLLVAVDRGMPYVRLCSESPHVPARPRSKKAKETERASAIRARCVRATRTKIKRLII